jgi:alpha-beta hydrolase superfamily lysophospholipase
VVKVSVLPTDVGGCLEMLRSIGSGADWFAAGRAALGVLLIRLNDSASSGSRALARLRQHVGDKKGTLVVLRGASSETLAADSTSDQALRRLLAAVKSQFDPGGILPALP